MKRNSFALTILSLLILCTTLSAQKEELEKMPEPIGGIMAIAKNVHYPETAKKAGVEGTVFVKATIDESGNVIETSILKSVGHGCDTAAMVAVKKTKFTAGIKDGKPVRTSITIPIKFKLDGEKKDDKG
jgi:protein TonB